MEASEAGEPRTLLTGVPRASRRADAARQAMEASRKTSVNAIEAVEDAMRGELASL
jgi:hypothetical protein